MFTVTNFLVTRSYRSVVFLNDRQSRLSRQADKYTWRKNAVLAYASINGQKLPTSQGVTQKVVHLWPRFNYLFNCLSETPRQGYFMSVHQVCLYHCGVEKPQSAYTFLRLFSAPFDKLVLFKNPFFCLFSLIYQPSWSSCISKEKGAHVHNNEPQGITSSICRFQ